MCVCVCALCIIMECHERMSLPLTDNGWLLRSTHTHTHARKYTFSWTCTSVDWNCVCSLEILHTHSQTGRASRKETIWKCFSAHAGLFCLFPYYNRDLYCVRVCVSPFELRIVGCGYWLPGLMVKRETICRNLRWSFAHWQFGVISVNMEISSTSARVQKTLHSSFWLFQFVYFDCIHMFSKKKIYYSIICIFYMKDLMLLLYELILGPYNNKIDIHVFCFNMISP